MMIERRTPTLDEEIAAGRVALIHNDGVGHKGHILALARYPTNGKTVEPKRGFCGQSLSIMSRVVLIDRRRFNESACKRCALRFTEAIDLIEASGSVPDIAAEVPESIKRRKPSRSGPDNHRPNRAPANRRGKPQDPNSRRLADLRREIAQTTHSIERLMAARERLRDEAKAIVMATASGVDSVRNDDLTDHPSRQNNTNA